ncbi:MAG TPA: starch-binding protein [Clostridiales bacterium]|nr:starch-binding protein [Clostridiales bacterium]
MVKKTQKKTSILLVIAMLITMFTIAGTSSISVGAASGDVVYFEKPTSWSGTPNCYAWGGTSGANSAWPGATMTLVEGNIYSYKMAGDQKNLIFNASGIQTADLTITGGNQIFKVTGESGGKATGAWSAYSNPVDPTNPTNPTSPTSTTNPTSATQPATPSGEGATAALKNAASWSSCYVYYWNGNKSNGTWPGVQLTDNDKDGEGNYVVDIPAEYIAASDAGVIFNNNGSGKSADLKISAGQCRIYDNKTASWTDYDTSAVKLAVTADCVSPQYKETDITLSANASGGSGSYQYKFSVGSAVLSDYSSVNQVVWTPTTAGSYSVVVEVKDTDGNTNKKTLAYEIKDDTLAVEPVLKGITPSTGSTVAPGTSTDVAVKASGGKTGTNLLFYKIAIKDPNGSSVNTVYYRTGNTLNFTPTQKGTYTVDVSVQNSANKTVTKSYSIECDSAANNPTVGSFTASVSSPQPKNTKVTLTAQGANGTAPYTYEYTVNGSVVKAYSATNTYVWQPTADGIYTLGVTVKDSAGKTAAATMQYTISTTEYVLGDANADGVVNLRDALYIQKCMALLDGYSVDSMTATQKLAADANKDGSINLRDALKIQQYLAGKTVLE